MQSMRWKYLQKIDIIIDCHFNVIISVLKMTYYLLTRNLSSEIDNYGSQELKELIKNTEKSSNELIKWFIDNEFEIYKNENICAHDAYAFSIECNVDNIVYKINILCINKKNFHIFREILDILNVVKPKEGKYEILLMKFPQKQDCSCSIEILSLEYQELTCDFFEMIKYRSMTKIVCQIKMKQYDIGLSSKYF